MEVLSKMKTRYFKITRLFMLLLVVFFIFFQKNGLSQTNNLDLQNYIPRLKKILSENIASFWLENSIDQRNGGYIINFGPKGETIEANTKMIVTQARTVW
jgi:hypothetical protein